MSLFIKQIDELVFLLNQNKIKYKDTILKEKFKMQHVSVGKIFQCFRQFLGKKIVVKGWVESTRQRFIDLNDGTSLKPLQLVINLKEKIWGEHLKKITRGTSITVVGTVIKSTGKDQDIDIDVSSLKFLGNCNISTYPLYKTKKGQPLTMEYLRKYQHLRARTGLIRASQTVRNYACKVTHDFFEERGFQYVHTPLITATDCEGAGECFVVTTFGKKNIKDIPQKKNGDIKWENDFFGMQSNLTVSGQLHVESFCHGIGNVYTFGPSFRAEKSHTNRHLSEFWMIEPEVSFCSFEDIQNLGEDYLKYCLKKLLNLCSEELMFLGNKYGRKENLNYLLEIVKADFARVTYTDAVSQLMKYVENKKIKILISKEKLEMIKKKIRNDLHINQEVLKVLECWQKELKIEFITGNIQIEKHKVISPKKYRKKYEKYYVFENPIYWGIDLSSEHEKYLTQHWTKRPTILTQYPIGIKSFYMKINSDRKTCQACDILVPGVGEVIGGSQREDDFDELNKRVLETGMNNGQMIWYLDLRRFGSIPHGGFGVGLERLIMLATGIDNIRDVIPFPRYPGNCQY